MRSLIAALALLLAGSAYAHEAPSGWQYPLECCSDRDCRELTDAETPKPLPGGEWLLLTGEIVPREKVKWSPDGRYHLCRSSLVVYCLFTPPQGS